MTTKGTYKLTSDPKDKVTFAGPFDGTNEPKVTLKLTNADDKERAWKVKCTSNAMFKIRPAVGTVDKAATATCTLTLKALKEADVPADNYHLFSIYHIPLGETKDGRKCWAEHKGDPEGSCRLPVTFDKAAGGGEKKDASKAADKKDEEKKDEKKDEEKKDDKKDEKTDEKKDDKEEKKDEKKEEKKEDKEDSKEKEEKEKSDKKEEE